MNIVSGCSWSCGEWPRLDTGKREVVFPGLEYNFQQDGIDCINLGIPSGSNLAVANKVRGWIERHPEHKIDKIYIFQTEWNRDLLMKYDEDYKDFRTVEELQGKFIARFYSRLSEIAMQAGCTVILIGGVSDTLWLDNIEEHYPGLQIGCQSLVNLILNDSHRIDNPIYSWYGTSIGEQTVKKVKGYLNDSELENFLSLIDAGLERETLVFSNPEFFWPDGYHPNRYAYAKLYKFLQENRYNGSNTAT